LDIDHAFKAATRAQKSWALLPTHERGRYLHHLARLIQEKSKELAIIETLDNGKPIKLSRDIDIPLAAQHFFHYAGYATNLNTLLPNSEPLGVVAAVIPWNFPLLMLAWKIAPALAAGNTIVLKPAETTSLSALYFTELVREAGIPKGVINILTGDGVIGEKIFSHKLAKKLTFTGSTKVGKSVALIGLKRNLPTTLELGGKGANIVFADAPIDEAIEGVINGIFFNQGHVCCAGSRLLVEESIAEEFVEKIKNRLTTIITGNPLDKNTDMGAINSAKQFANITKFLSLAENEGVEIVSGKITEHKNGYYIPPTLCLYPEATSELIKNEIFGPVLTVQTFRTPQEAVSKANNTSYGLSAGIWSSDLSLINSLTKNLHAGTIWVNTFNKFHPSAPFGGYKESGFGRESGIESLRSYVKERYNDKNL